MVKKVKEKMSEAIIGYSVHVRVECTYILGPNVHVWLLKNSEYNLISSFLTKIVLDSHILFILSMSLILGFNK